MPLQLSSEFLAYLADTYDADGDCERLPSLHALSGQLGVSVSSLREQMEVARALGLVEAKPRTGMRRLPYSFTPAVEQSLFFALNLDPDSFLKFADLRQNLETAYWYQAVDLLTEDDQIFLQDLMGEAWAKLRGTPIKIPQLEHRQLHMTIYRRLDNPFVSGILEAYWDAYEAVGLNLYADYHYLEEVWSYHQRMVDAICGGALADGYQALVEHNDLIRHRVVQDENGRTQIAHSN